MRAMFLKRTVRICQTEKPHFYRKGGAWWVLVPMPPGCGVVRTHRCVGPSLRAVQRKYGGG